MVRPLIYVLKRMEMSILVETLTPAEDFRRLIAEKINRDIKAFFRATDGEDELQVILRGHLYIEHEFEKMLRNHLVEPQFILDNRFMFMNKLNLATSLGLISVSKRNSYKKFNDLRNKYAHTLNFKMAEKDLNGLIDSMDKDLRNEFFDADWTEQWKGIYGQNNILRLRYTVLSLWSYITKLVFTRRKEEYDKQIILLEEKYKDADYSKEEAFLKEAQDLFDDLKASLGFPKAPLD